MKKINLTLFVIVSLLFLNIHIKAVEIDVADEQGNTKMHNLLTFDSGTTRNLSTLVEEEELSVNAQNSDGNTPLMSIIENLSSEEGSEYLMESNSLGVAGSFYNFVEAMIDYGLDVNISNNSGDTILHTLVKNVDSLFFLTDVEWDDSQTYFQKIVEALYDAGIDVAAQNDEGKTAIDIALENQDKEIVKILLETTKKVDV